ncbi:MAG: hypothetical protein ABSA83_14895 [Verrucomicrobiota bacterium]
MKSIRDEFAPILAMGALLAWSIDHRQTSGIIVSGIILGALLLLYPVFHVCFRRTKRLFKKMHSARTWQRWDEVLDCLNKLQDSQRSTNIVIGDSSMVRYRALALAGLGKVDDAVAYFRNAAEKADMPKGLYFGLLANIYAVAKQYDKALACHRQALQEATDKSTACIDLGIYLVRRFNRPEEARPLLAQAETAQLSELARLHLHVVRGMIAFREKDYKAMDKEMLEALAGFQKRALPRPYIFEGSIRTTQGCLAISNAALGNKAAAVRYFAQSEQYLATIGLDDLLTQYRDLIAKC